MMSPKGWAVLLGRGALLGYLVVSLVGVAVEMGIGLVWELGGFGSFDISAGPVLLLGITRLADGGVSVPFEGPVVVGLVGATVGLVVAIHRGRSRLRGGESGDGG